MIRVNGKTTSFAAGSTLQELIDQLHYDFPLLFVRVDRKVVRKTEWRHYAVPGGAEVEITPIVAGG